MRVVFLGTPDFAILPLEAILASNHELIAVVTGVDKRAKRNKQIVFSPVKEFALKHNLKLYQFNKISSEENMNELKKLNADIFVTAAFGQILSQKVLDIPKYGVINIHASLLPKYRGSSPIQSAILNGDAYTGITIMQTELSVDTGDIILQKRVKIEDSENSLDLFNKLSKISKEAIIEALDLIEQGKATYIKQDDSLASYTKLIKKEDGKINFNSTFFELNNFIRGMYPWPSAYCFLDNKILKIFEIEPSKLQIDGEYGTIMIHGKEIHIKILNGSIIVKELQLEGKSRINGSSFINGYKFKDMLLR